MHFIRRFVLLAMSIFILITGNFAYAQFGGNGQDSDQVSHQGGTVSFEALAREFGQYGSTASQIYQYTMSNPDHAKDWSDDKKARMVTYTNQLVRKGKMTANELIAYNKVQNIGIFDTVVEQFQQAGVKWQSTFIKYAEWLFWTLFSISFTLQMCYSYLEGGESRAIFAQLVKYCITAGVAIFILRNGATLAGVVFSSLQQIGVEAGGLSMDATTPSGIVDVGMDIFAHVIEDTSWSDVAISLVRVLCALGNLLILAYVAIRFAVLIIMGWMLAFIGLLTLGLAGLEQTKDVLGNYVKTVIGYGLEMMTFLLIVGVVFNIASVAMKGASSPGELGLSILASLVMAFLTTSLPSAISALVTGSTIHSGTNLANSAKGLAVAGAGMAGMAIGSIAGATIGKKAGEMMDSAKKDLGLGDYSGKKMAKNAVRDDKVAQRANNALSKMGRSDLSQGGGNENESSGSSSNTFS